jgi:hypothetical protein
MLMTFVVASLLGAPPASAEPAPRFSPAVNAQSGPSIASTDLGLAVSRREDSLIYYASDDAGLAMETRDVLSAMHREAARIIGVPVKVHGIILVTDTRQLPERIRNAYWVNVDGVSCVVQIAQGELANQGDSFHKILFMLIHESVDPGIKAAIFGGRLTQATASSRWWIEGIADYAATQASLRFDRRALSMTKAAYARSLASINQSSLDLENPKVWWPSEQASPETVQYAYAAANYVIAGLSKASDEWISQTLLSFESGALPGPTSETFCQRASKHAGNDVRVDVRDVKIDQVRTFAASL